MLHDGLGEDAKAVILLCGVLGKRGSEKTLSPGEYAVLERWLREHGASPRDLLSRAELVAEAAAGAGVEAQRMASLLGRGIQLGFAVDEWRSLGIWIVTKSDADYPDRLRRHLRAQAPPLLFGAGRRDLLEGGGLGVVGSRNVDEAGAEFTRLVAERWAMHGGRVVSGGARGVDQIAMLSALEAGAVAVGIVADSLLRQSTERSAREWIADGRLLLLSPYRPDAPFRVGAAMGRNKLVYAMSDCVLVVSADDGKGGTWAGAKEELARPARVPVFVRVSGSVPTGNGRLLELGAVPWSEDMSRDAFYAQCTAMPDAVLDTPACQERGLFDSGSTGEAPPGDDQAQTPETAPGVAPDAGVAAAAVPDAVPDTPAGEEQGSFDGGSTGEASRRDDQGQMRETAPGVAPDAGVDEPMPSTYELVLPRLLHCLSGSMTADDLAAAMEVNKQQMNAWLKRAVEDGEVDKLSGPVRYRRSGPRLALD